jgi:23S rRNA pseudouridine2605 synthase
VSERLQKWLAGQGLGSRRQIETWIEAGRVTVDGETAVLGKKVSGTERIAVDGKLVRVDTRKSFRPQCLIYHKPAGEICSRSDPEGRPTVFDRLPHLAHGRWISVGRLDFQTSGLLLLTNDGELANRLMHPSSGMKREYAVRVIGEVSDESLRRLRKGVQLDDGPASFETVESAGGEGRNRWYKVEVSEGRNRIVRRIFEAVGYRVSRLIRIRYGPISLPRPLPAGKFRRLNASELDSLYEAVGIESDRSR